VLETINYSFQLGKEGTITRQRLIHASLRVVGQGSLRECGEMTNVILGLAYLKPGAKTKDFPHKFTTFTMEINTSTQDASRPVPARDTARIGHPVVLLEVEENGVSEEIVYPTGHRLWLTMASLCIAMFLKGLVC
jgi:hypothetical protein